MSGPFELPAFVNTIIASMTTFKVMIRMAKKIRILNILDPWTLNTKGGKGCLMANVSMRECSEVLVHGLWQTSSRSVA